VNKPGPGVRGIKVGVRDLEIIPSVGIVVAASVAGTFVFVAEEIGEDVSVYISIIWIGVSATSIGTVSVVIFLSTQKANLSGSLSNIYPTNTASRIIDNPKLNQK